MTESGLAALSPYDFEVLCQDLLRSAWGVNLEGFTRGRDGGIDLRVLQSGKTRPALVVQCKHYFASGYAGLKSKIKAEAQTAAAIGATRYVLATSVPMTPARKQELSEILTSAQVPCSPSDILGREDIHTLIRENPDVEKSHFKLWLNSSAVLDRLLHNELYVRSQGYVEELRSNAAIFVQNGSVDSARDILERSHTVLISGPPGVGKTTLSEILLLQAMADGFQAVIVSADIDEADKIYTTGARQVFLYDDFLGRTTGFEKLGKNEDDRLLRFIKRIEKSTSKLLILTTREYILRQARVSFDRLNDPAVELHKYVLDVGVYTRRNRGHILYNHVYFSGVSNEARRSLRTGRRYVRLVDHDNYNPRLIGDAIALFGASGRPDSDFGEYLLEAFQNPTELWRHVFKHQISRLAKRTLAVLTLLEKPAQVSALERLHATMAHDLGDDESFEETMRSLEGTSITVNTSAWGTTVDFANPGVQDAALSVLLPDAQILRSIIDSSHDFELLLRLWVYASEPERGVPGRFSFGPSSLSRTASHLLDVSGVRTSVLRRPLRARLVTIAENLVARMLSTAQSGLHGTTAYTERLGLIVAVAHDLESQDSNGGLADAIIRDAESWGAGDDKADAIVLVERVLASPAFASKIKSDLVAAARAWFESSLNRPRDFELIVQLDALDPATDVSDHRELEADFAASVKDVMGSWEDVDDPDDLRALVSEVEEAADALGISLPDIDPEFESQLSEIDDRIALLERDDYEPDYEPDRDRGSSSFTGDEDRWLEGLFDTLDG